MFFFSAGKSDKRNQCDASNDCSKPLFFQGFDLKSAASRT